MYVIITVKVYLLCIYYVSNETVFIMYQTDVTESNFQGGHLLINDAFHDCQQLLSISSLWSTKV